MAKVGPLPQCPALALRVRMGDPESANISICLQAPLCTASQISRQEAAADFLSLDLMSISSSLAPALTSSLRPTLASQATLSYLGEDEGKPERLDSKTDPGHRGPQKGPSALFLLILCSRPANDFSQRLTGRRACGLLLPPGSWVRCLSQPQFPHLCLGTLINTFQVPLLDISLALPGAPSETEAGKRGWTWSLLQSSPTPFHRLGLIFLGTAGRTHKVLGFG